MAAYIGVIEPTAVQEGPLDLSINTELNSAEEARELEKRELIILSWHIALDDLDAAGITWERWQKYMLGNEFYKQQFTRYFLCIYYSLISSHGLPESGEIEHWCTLCQYCPDWLMQGNAELMDDKVSDATLTPRIAEAELLW